MAYLRTLVNATVKPVPNFVFQRFLHHPRHKLIINVLVNKQAGSSRADLPSVEINAEMTALYRLIDCRETSVSTRV
jgi:hypothetical protein